MQLNTIACADCIAWLKTLPDACADACVTDPPYELGFMGKKWDGTGIAYKVELWAEVLRVLKPGAHLLAFGGTRTCHRMICAIEDAGFEVRDMINWLHGNGFPKSRDIGKAIDAEAGVKRKTAGTRPTHYPDSDTWSQKGVTRAENSYRGGLKANQIDRARPTTAPATAAAKQWDGWGTALKPGHEPICVARKPLSESTVAANVLTHGTGAINVDGCRVKIADMPKYAQDPKGAMGYGGGKTPSLRTQGVETLPGSCRHRASGRWPANVALDEDAARELDAQTGELDGGCIPYRRHGLGYGSTSKGQDAIEDGGRRFAKGGVSRFFYCAKASKAERDAGLRGPPVNFSGGGCVNHPKADAYGARKQGRNYHPTVKPLALMRWLCRLVTPPGGVILDPFAGSGTTCIAAVREGFNYLACDLEPEYVAIARARIADALGPLFA